ncbi:MAG: outer membrane lipoprotein-sorting protein [Candidatus Methylomirabilis sp.]|nr:outer membrane lipoprotein-sorting protein [Deltaproteobacteria bacterium]
MRLRLAALASLCILASPPPARAGGWEKAEYKTARDVVESMDRKSRGETNQGKAVMRIVRPDWERTLEMDFWSIGLDLTFVRVTAPAKERGVGSLQIGQEMWNYLPKTERVVRIPASLMGQAWLGSDFTNDDLVKQSSVVVDYDHAFKEEGADRAGEPCWIVESTAKEDAAVVWGKMVWTVRKKDLNATTQDFYDEKGVLVKKMLFSDVRRAGDRDIPFKMEMIPVLEPGKRTYFEYKEVVFNEPIDKGLFTLQNLQRVRAR